MSNEVRTTDIPNLKSFLDKHVGSIKQVATKTLTPDRMVKLVCAAATREPKLAECSPISILRSMVQAAELGLEVCSGKNEAYLVPRWNSKSRCTEATFLPGYQGLVKLALESGAVRNIEARVVYAKDSFDYELGISPILKHKPYLGSDRGEIIAAYAIAYLVTGACQFEVMPRHEIDEIRDRGRDNKSFSPWSSDYSEMARKTVIRRLYKYIPKTHAVASALQAQAEAEGGWQTSFDDHRPGDEIEVTSIKTIDGDGIERFEWTDEQEIALSANLEALAERGVELGKNESEIKSKCNYYKDKMLSGEHPDTVLNQIAGALLNWG